MRKPIEMLCNRTPMPLKSVAIAVALVMGEFSPALSASDADGQKTPGVESRERARPRGPAQPRQQPIAGRVVLKSDPKRGVAQAVVRCIPLETPTGFLNAVTDSEGNFQTDRGACAMLVQARSEDGSLAGIVLISADDAKLTIPVAPPASAKGRVVDQDTGKPLPDRRINFGVRANFVSGGFIWGFGSSATTDAKGEFKLTGLVPGWTYDVNTWQAGPKPSMWTLGSLIARSPGTIELGEIKLGPSDTPRRGTRSAPVFDPNADASANVETALKSAKRDHKRVLICFGGNWCGGCNRLFDVFKSHPDVSSVLEKNFVVVPVNVETNQKLFENYAKPIEPTGFPQLAVIDVDAKVVANETIADLQAGLKLDVASLKAFLEKSSPAK